MIKPSLASTDFYRRNKTMQLALTPLRRDADYLDEQGAWKLAATIRAFWNARGFKPDVWTRKLLTPASPTAGDRVIYVVESDMVGGRPL